MIFYPLLISLAYASSISLKNSALAQKSNAIKGSKLQNPLYPSRFLLKKFNGQQDHGNKKRFCSITEYVPRSRPGSSNFIIGDGNCFYRAVSFYVFGGDQSHYKFIRRNAMKVIRKNKEEFSSILEEDGGVDAFIKVHSRDTVYAEHECIIATAIAFMRPIRIYYANQNKVYIYTPHNAKTRKSIDLYFDRNHYEIFRNLRSNLSASVNSMHDNVLLSIQKVVLSIAFIFLLFLVITDASTEE